MGVSHLEGAPQEGGVETEEHLRHTFLGPLLVDVAQDLLEEVKVQGTRLKVKVEGTRLKVKVQDTR